MLLIPCPWCGPRIEDEFACGGELKPGRPRDPTAFSDAEWADYVFNSDNVKGTHRERWWHAKGCRRWFTVERDTVSHRIATIGAGDGE